jgi:hypothetical protein
MYVVFSNMFESTDGAGDVESCPAARTAGFDEPLADPSGLWRLVIRADEQLTRFAVETGSDMILLLENFCAQGDRNEDPAGRCCRGANAERWFDVSCIPPNPTGHRLISDMFQAAVGERAPRRGARAASKRTGTRAASRRTRR